MLEVELLLRNDDVSVHIERRIWDSNRGPLVFYDLPPATPAAQPTHSLLKASSAHIEHLSILTLCNRKSF